MLWFELDSTHNMVALSLCSPTERCLAFPASRTGQTGSDHAGNRLRPVPTRPQREIQDFCLSLSVALSPVQMAADVTTFEW